MRNLRRHERGATLLEGAVTALLFFTLILGVIEFGRAYNQYQVMTLAAREGARFSVAPFSATATLPTVQDVKDRVQRFLKSSGVNVPDTNITVTQNVSATVNGVQVVYTQVTVNAPYRFFFFRFGSVTMGTTSMMRNENQ